MARGLEVNVIWVDTTQRLLFVAADSRFGLLDHLFAVSLDGVHCKRYIAEAKGTNQLIHRFGYDEEDLCSGLYAMRQYRKVKKDVMAYIQEQQTMGACAS